MSITGGEPHPLANALMRLLVGEAVFHAHETYCARRQVNQHADASGQTDADDEMYAPDGFPRALWWDTPANTLRLVDQTLLPARYRIHSCTTADEVAEAIRMLRVRGAPAIGVAAGYGLALEARCGSDVSVEPQDLLARLQDSAERLRATRPTAVNLAWALGRLIGVAEQQLAEGNDSAGLADRLLLEAHAIAAEDAAACRAIGMHGASLIADGDTLLTHCNAGALATGGMGTALAPIYTAHGTGKRISIFVDETRPVLQGARLTAWELQRAGVPITLIADNMAAHILKTRGVRAIFVGADRIAANGDTANKIGTYGLAVIAHAHGVPFYVVAPRSTVDLTLPDGGGIPIEERDAGEVTTLGGVQIAPEGIAVANPAFDVTPARYITAIITEAGILRPPYVESLAAVVHPMAAAAEVS
jgi:methylthioribose-1-phosphate isomerase